jgi:hypothetical protein
MQSAGLTLKQSLKYVLVNVFNNIKRRNILYTQQRDHISNIFVMLLFIFQIQLTLFCIEMINNLLITNDSLFLTTLVVTRN